MKLKKCSCGIENTTKTAKKVGRDDLALYFNCVCASTFVLLKKNWKKIVDTKLNH